MFSSDLSSRKTRTRISAHFVDTPVEGDLATVEGWVTFYDETKKSWIPMERAKIHIYLDGREIGEAETNNYGMYSYSFLAPSAGKHKLEVRFKGKEKAGYEVSSKSLDFHVLKKEEKRRLGRALKTAFVLILVMIFLMLLTVFMAKLRVTVYP